MHLYLRSWEILQFLPSSVCVCVCVFAPPGTVRWSWTQEQACPARWQPVCAPRSPWTGGWRRGEWYRALPLRCWRRSRFPWCRSSPNPSGRGGEERVISHLTKIKSKVYFRVYLVWCGVFLSVYFIIYVSLQHSLGLRELGCSSEFL